jgi:uncharacterized protein
MPPTTLTLFVDADACPVKDEAVKVGVRHGMTIYFVANSWMRLPEGPGVERVVVPEGPDVADTWIAERASPQSIVVTADIPLSDRAIKAGALVVTPQGKLLNASNIGTIVATRNLMHDLRETGAVQTFNKTFAPRDRSQFLQALEDAAQRVKRAQK